MVALVAWAPVVVLVAELLVEAALAEGVAVSGLLIGFATRIQVGHFLVKWLGLTEKAAACVRVRALRVEGLEILRTLVLVPEFHLGRVRITRCLLSVLWQPLWPILPIQDQREITLRESAAPLVVLTLQLRDSTLLPATLT